MSLVLAILRHLDCLPFSDATSCCFKAAHAQVVGQVKDCDSAVMQSCNHEGFLRFPTHLTQGAGDVHNASQCMDTSCMAFASSKLS